MSKATDIATKVLKDIDEGRNVENTDIMYLRVIVAADEKTLPPDEMARRVLKSSALALRVGPNAYRRFCLPF